MKKHTPARSGRSGFTLIELMIALAIVALLAAVALPAYTEHVNRGKRAEGQAALMTALQLQERAYTVNGQYTNNAAFHTLYGLTAGPVHSGQDPANTNGWYVLTVVAPAGCANLQECVTIQAAPNQAGPNGRVYTDARCGTMTLDSRGERTESGDKDLAYCWR